MKAKISEISDILKEQIANFDKAVQVSETGRIISVTDGIARVYGLEKVRSGEWVEIICRSGDIVKAIASNLEVDNVGIVIVENEHFVQEGDTVRRTDQIVSVPAGKGLLGRVVNGLGNPIDGMGPLKDVIETAVERKAPDIISRKSVHEPMQTGIKALDALVPIGCGQRELIIGDRQTGKTTIAIDTILVGA